MENNDVLLSNLTDKQKTLLSSLSYLNIDMTQYSELKNKNNIKVSDLKALFKDGDSIYLGDNAKIFGGVDITQNELIEQMEREGLGELKITDIVQNSETGFSAMAFSDSNNNVGISYRGTDGGKFDLDLLKDSLVDTHEFLADTSPQVQEALDFFNKNKGKGENNYLYGHSLGGNLTQHVYLENYKDISNAFSINPLAIDQDLLDTKEKIAAFNDPNKFDCVVIGGDPISELKDYNSYANNVTYVVNNDVLNNNMIGNHLVESASYDKMGNFIKADSKEQAYNSNTSLAQGLVVQGVKTLGDRLKGVVNFLKPIGHAIKTGFENVFQKGKDIFENVTEGVKGFFGNRKENLSFEDDIGFKENRNILPEETNTKTSNSFLDSLKCNELSKEDISKNLASFAKIREGRNKSIEDEGLFVRSER